MDKVKIITHTAVILKQRSEYVMIWLHNGKIEENPMWSYGLSTEKAYECYRQQDGLAWIK